MAEPTDEELQAKQRAESLTDHRAAATGQPHFNNMVEPGDDVTVVLVGVRCKDCKGEPSTYLCRCGGKGYTAKAEPIASLCDRFEAELQKRAAAKAT